MFKILFGLAMVVLGLWLWMGDPATDSYGKWFGDYVHGGFVWLSKARPYSTILAFVFAVASFMMIKKY